MVLNRMFEKFYEDENKVLEFIKDHNEGVSLKLIMTTFELDFDKSSSIIRELVNKNRIICENGRWFLL